MSKHKLKMAGVYTDYNATDRILTMTEVSLQGLSKTKVYEYNEHSQIIKETCDNSVITYDYDDQHRLTRAVKTIKGRTICIVTYSYENGYVVKTYRYNRRTQIQKTDSNMNIIFESTTYSDGTEDIHEYRYNNNDCMISDECIEKARNAIVHHTISHYDDNGKLIKTDNIAIK